METGAKADFSKVDRLLGDLADCLDLSAPGTQEESFGKDLLADIAVHIGGRSLGDQKAPSGIPWAPNRGGYAKAKDQRGLPVGVGLDPQSEDRMLSHLQLMGEQNIASDSATIKYGTSETARKKAEWFTAGSDGGMGIEPSGAKNQPGRPFYGLDDEIRQTVIEKCNEHIKEWLSNK